jgi:hypothetical protein
MSDRRRPAPRSTTGDPYGPLIAVLSLVLTAIALGIALGTSLN